MGLLKLVANPMSLFLNLSEYWQTELSDLEYKINQIDDLLRHEAKTSMLLPAKGLVFRALQVTPDEAKVIIVGQDPYPNFAHACGLSFSVPANTQPLAGSLRNIFAEIKTDMGYQSNVTNGDLTPWVNQGVVLLNRVLTVKEGQSGSHNNLGWQEITDRIIKKYSEHAVGLLLGGTAKETKHLFAANQVVCSVHPSPLSAHKGFFGSKPFSQVNKILRSMGKAEIQW